MNIHVYNFVETLLRKKKTSRLIFNEVFIIIIRVFSEL